MPDQTPPTRDRASTITALTALIPGANPENMNVVVTETTAEGDQHSWSGSLAGLADRIHAHDAAFPPITAHVVVTRTPVTVTQYGFQGSDGEVSRLHGDREYAERIFPGMRKLAGDPMAALVERTVAASPWAAVDATEGAA